MDKALGIDSQIVIIDGKERTLAPPTLGMLADFAKHFRQKPIRDFVELARETGMDKDFVNEQLKALYREQAADKRDIDTMFSEYAGTEEGVLYLIYLCLKNSGITLDEVRALPVGEIQAVQVAIDAYFRASVSEDDQKKIQAMQAARAGAAK